MKKIFLHFVAFLFLFSLTVLPVLAATSTPRGIGSAFDFENNQNLTTTGAEAGYLYHGEGSDRFDSIVGTLITLGFSVMGVVFTIIIIIAGLKWMTSDGNDEKVGAAKRSLRNAIIGLGITLAAYAISYFVMNLLLQGPTLSTTN